MQQKWTKGLALGVALALLALAAAAPAAAMPVRGWGAWWGWAQVVWTWWSGAEGPAGATRVDDPEAREPGQAEAKAGPCIEPQGQPSPCK